MSTTRRRGLPLVFLLTALLLFFTTSAVYAAPIDNVPVTVTQPDGTKVDLLASGDEYYNWLHDANGYTVIQDPDTGYYVYADLVNGKLVSTSLIAGRSDPASKGIQPRLNISAEEKTAIRQARQELTSEKVTEVHNAPNTGTINNLVVFIHFADESEFTDTTLTYTDMLNKSTAGYNSFHNYYKEVSYNQLSINSTLYPTPGATIVSYQDSHVRAYFQPYNAITNTIGYTSANSTSREHTLLRDATNYVSGLGQFPGGATIDMDNDGYVDSINFVIYGSPGGWSDLLWPHQWSLFTYNVLINGKTIDKYTLHLSSMIHNGVLSHETFHLLGAPDLYHYVDNGMSPVGWWDVMERDADPPQHMGCYMKYKYGKWIASLPTITPGAYTLSPLTSSTNNCYKIASPNSTTQFFVVEYRQDTGTFESSLPDSGLLVYRINSAANGNGNGPPDEVYVYRPEGTPSLDGIVDLANFSLESGRTAINDTTDPSSFLENGSAGGLNISAIGSSSGATMSFYNGTIVPPPGAFNKISPLNGATGQSTSPVLSWSASSSVSYYEYCYDTSNDNACSAWVSTGTTASANLSGLSARTTYYWQVRANNGYGTTYANWSSTAYWQFTTTAPTVTPTPIAPSATITDTTPLYKWTKIRGATQYRFQLKKGAATIYTKTITASKACGSATVCKNNPTTVLAFSTYKWKVQAFVGGSWKAYSAYQTFNILPPGSPKSGYWSGYGNNFYVASSRVKVQSFKVYITACGNSYSISRTLPVSIVNKKFSFTGSYYASGNFDTTSKAHGTVGLNHFYLPYCGYVSGGPLSWSATWKSSGQPIIQSKEGVLDVIVEPALNHPDTFNYSVDTIEIVP